MVDINGVIKSLECCVADGNSSCKECIANGGGEDCHSMLARYALKTIDDLKQECFDLNEDIISLHIDNDNLRIDIPRQINAIKREAAKEFAESLKEKLFYECGDINYTEGCEIIKLIDSLLKEMTEEK